MAINLLFGRKNPGKIGDLQLDATLAENHQYNSEVTSYPVENGSTITDNVRKLPIRVSVNGFVSNSPVRYLAGALGSKVRNEENANYVELARDFLIDLYDNPQEITLETGLKQYPNMIMETLNIPRNQVSQDAIRFNAEFVQIEKAISETVEIANVDREIAESQTNTGRDSTKGASTAQESKGSSILNNFLFGGN